MFFIFGVFLLVCVYGAKIYPVKQFNTGYLSRSSTTAVKGIFTFLVFLSHFTQYYTMHTVFDNPYKIFKSFIGQTVVAMFFFYSGYGVLESIKKKGSVYVRNFPKNRILKTVFHLDVALIFYLILDAVLKIKITLPRFLLSLIGWKDVGNSSWFIFTIAVLYFLCYLSFTVFKNKTRSAVAFSCLLTVLYIVVVSRFKDYWWYDSALCLPLEMVYSLAKEKAEKILMKNDITFFAVLVLTAALFFLLQSNCRQDVIKILANCVFSLLVCLVTMKVSVGNKALNFLGNHVFSIYILQRIPMTVFSRIDVLSSNRYLFFTLSFAVTLILAYAFDLLTGAIDKKLFAPKQSSAPAVN